MRLSPRGVLIVFEGIDGVGKTTQADRLEAWVRQAGLPVVRTKEPTSGPWGRLLRASAATGRLAPDEELRAFIEDRKQHVAEVLSPGLADGAVVIVDRYYFSTAAYQGARGHDPQAILRENEAFAPAPDLLVLLDLELDRALERIAQRGDVGNLFERREDLAKSAAIFATLQRPYLLRLDAALSAEALAERVREGVCALGPVAAACG